MITVKTKETTYQHIVDFEIWQSDENYFIFYFEKDLEYVIIRKDLVLSIKKR